MPSTFVLATLIGELCSRQQHVQVPYCSPNFILQVYVHFHGSLIPSKLISFKDKIGKCAPQIPWNCISESASRFCREDLFIGTQKASNPRISASLTTLLRLPMQRLLNILFFFFFHNPLCYLCVLQEIGQMKVTVEEGNWRGEPCYLVHANSDGIVDQVQIGTSVIGELFL